MKILFLTNLLPYPLDSGGKIKTYTTISILAEAAHEIDLLCFTEQKNPENKFENEVLKLCRRVEQIYHKLTTAENMSYMLLLAAKSLLSPYSFGLYKFRSDLMKQKLSEICSKEQYDFIYFDHLQLCVYRDYLKKLLPGAKMILDEHNCETLIMSRNADKVNNLLKKIFLHLESRKLRKFESKMLQNMDENIILSREDYTELRKQSNKDFKHTIIPIGVSDRGTKTIRDYLENNLNILFLGTLTWEPNNQGLIWFLKEVIPLLEKEKMCYTFYIVGKNPSEDVQKLSERYNNVIVTGYVESVDDYYEKCDCMVVPLFIGSGQRVKLIEGFSRGMPSISTSIGAEGLEILNLDNILIADTADEFRKSIGKMYDYETRYKLSKAARICYEKNYSPIAISKKLNEVIKKRNSVL